MQCARDADLKRYLPEKLRLVHRLGELVGLGLQGAARGSDLMEIYTLGTRMGVAEWMTGAQTRSVLPIVKTVASRLSDIDELFSTRGIPPEHEAAGTGGASIQCPPAESVAAALAQHIDRRLEQIKDDMADYATLASQDQQEPVPSIEPLLSIPQAMKLSGLSRRKLVALIAEGKIAVKIMGKRQKVIPESLRTYVVSADPKANPETAVNPQKPWRGRRQSIPDHLGR